MFNRYIKNLFFGLFSVLIIITPLCAQEVISDLVIVDLEGGAKQSDEALSALNEELRKLDIEEQIKSDDKLDLQDRKIENLATPTASTDAVNKAYVDALILRGSAVSSFQVQPASDQTNIAVGSDVTVVFGTENFDVGGDFASNTFTAPITGKYLLSVSLVVTNMSSEAGAIMKLKIKTTARDYEADFDCGPWGGSPGWTFPLQVIADMTAGDTAYVTLQQAAGPQQSDIDTDSIFSGSLM